MATSSKDPRKKPSTPKGVRGPSGPPSSSGSPRPAPASSATGGRATLERISFPILAKLNRLPRWLIVVLPAILLLGGLLLRDSWSWLGGILLLAVWVFLTWLTALSWPALDARGRMIRGIIVLFFGGIVVLKFTGSF